MATVFGEARCRKMNSPTFAYTDRIKLRKIQNLFTVDNLNENVCLDATRHRIAAREMAPLRLLRHFTIAMIWFGHHETDLQQLFMRLGEPIHAMADAEPRSRYRFGLLRSRSRFEAPNQQPLGIVRCDLLVICEGATG